MNQKKLIFIFFVIVIIAILHHHSVNNKLVAADYEYIPKYLNNINPVSELSSYQEQLDFISSVQLTSFDLVPNAGTIAKNQKREPKELFYAKVADCSARSRLLEKILRYSGFKTRHVAIYVKENTTSSIKPILTPNNRSHALTEVLTKRGWLVVDSNSPWLSIDSQNNPVSIKKIQQSINNSVTIEWKINPVDDVYSMSFVILYGVYSRHGRFYPPYNFIPDINYSEFIQNVY
jgi:hypothetical protein